MKPQAQKQLPIACHGDGATDTWGFQNNRLTEARFASKYQLKNSTNIPSVTSSAFIWSSPFDLVTWSGDRIAVRLSRIVSFNDSFLSPLAPAILHSLKVKNNKSPKRNHFIKRDNTILFGIKFSRKDATPNKFCCFYGNNISRIHIFHSTNLTTHCQHSDWKRGLASARGSRRFVEVSCPLFTIHFHLQYFQNEGESILYAVFALFCFCFVQSKSGHCRSKHCCDTSGAQDRHLKPCSKNVHVDHDWKQGFFNS